MKRALIAAALVGFAVFYRHRYVQFYAKPAAGCCVCCEALADLDDEAMADFEAAFWAGP